MAPEKLGDKALLPFIQCRWLVFNGYLTLSFNSTGLLARFSMLCKNNGVGMLAYDLSFLFVIIRENILSLLA